jgi:hypothetical protein
MLRIPHCLDSRLRDIGKVISLTHPPYFTPQKHYYFYVSGTHCCLRLSKPQGLVRFYVKITSETLRRWNIVSHIIGGISRCFLFHMPKDKWMRSNLAQCEWAISKAYSCSFNSKLEQQKTETSSVDANYGFFHSSDFGLKSTVYTKEDEMHYVGRGAAYFTDELMGSVCVVLCVYVWSMLLMCSYNIAWA